MNFTRIVFVFFYLYVFACIRMYLYASRMLVVCIRMYPYVTRMLPIRTRVVSLVSDFRGDVTCNARIDRRMFLL